ncbi:MAG: DUF4159 domain-containing protein [Planctomycetota bacterium]
MPVTTPKPARRTRRGETWWAPLLATLVVCAAGLNAARAQAVGPDEIDNAVEILKANLYRMQDQRTGGWFGKFDETPGFERTDRDGGMTVLATYALLAAGESPEVDDRLAKAVDYVVKSQREWTDQVDGTYVIGLRNHIWPLLPRELYASALERDTKRILAGASDRGTFGYKLREPPTNPDRYDNSTTQYGVLGLWEAAKNGGRVPDSFWERAAQHFIDSQHANGGWSYNPDKNTSESMTCAGLTVLSIAQQQLGRSGKVANRQIQEAMDRGLEYLDENFDGPKNVYSGAGYFVYGVERVALATGRSRFGNNDWFDTLARYIVNRVNKPSDDVHTQPVNSAFFLLFLARGDTPVFFNKLDLSAAEQTWNNRPNDIYFLAKELSETFQSELNFRTLPIDWSIERWLGAPITYVSIDAPLELDEAHTRTIRRYLDLGGLLIVNPEGNARRIARSVDELLQAMYPGAKLEDAPADYPALTLWRPVRRPPGLKRYHNGVRDLVLFFEDDIGFDWQKGGRDGQDAYVLGANLYLHATGYQRMDGRAATHYPRDPGAGARGPSKTVAVVTPRPDLEPGLWEWQRRELGRAPKRAVNRRNYTRPAEEKPVANLAVVRQAWEDAGEPVKAHGQTGPPDLLHLVGITGTRLSDEAVQRVIDFARAGGTVLIETLGGTGDFAPMLEEQFAAALGQPPERLSRYEGVFAADADKNTYDLGRVTYRAYSVRNFSTDHKPRLSGFRVNDRPAIFVSGEDLSLAAMGVRHWNLHGYSDESARQILSNLLLNEW